MCSPFPAQECRPGEWKLNGQPSNNGHANSPFTIAAQRLPLAALGTRARDSVTDTLTCDLKSTPLATSMLLSQRAAHPTYC